MGKTETLVFTACNFDNAASLQYPIILRDHPLPSRISDLPMLGVNRTLQLYISRLWIPSLNMIEQVRVVQIYRFAEAKLVWVGRTPGYLRRYMFTFAPISSLFRLSFSFSRFAQLFIPNEYSATKKLHLLPFPTLRYHFKLALGFPILNYLIPKTVMCFKSNECQMYDQLSACVSIARYSNKLRFTTNKKQKKNESEERKCIFRRRIRGFRKKNEDETKNVSWYFPRESTLFCWWILRIIV